MNATIRMIASRNLSDVARHILKSRMRLGQASALRGLADAYQNSVCTSFFVAIFALRREMAIPTSKRAPTADKTVAI